MRVRLNFSFVVRCLSCSVVQYTGGNEKRLASPCIRNFGRSSSGIAQLKQSYEPTALNAVLFPSLCLKGGQGGTGRPQNMIASPLYSAGL